MSEQSVPPVIQKPPVIPKTAAQPALKSRKPAAEGKLKEVLFRAGIFILLATSLLLAWWSYFQLLGSQQKQVRDLTTQVSRLSAEVDELDRRWSPTDASSVSNAFSKVPRALFTGPASLESWWNGLTDYAEPLGLEIKVDFGKIHQPTTKYEKVSIIPTTVALDIRPAPDLQAIETAYNRVLRFSQRLSYNEKRTDITQLSVTGGSNSVAHVDMALALWASEEETAQ